MEYTNSFKELFLFELKSFLGRKILNTTPKLKERANYLNLGCGSRMVEGYINADFFFKFKFWKKHVGQLEWQLDLRYPLDCPDSVFDGVFSEHTFEHLYPSQAKTLLRELYRIMKKDAYIRVTVPDIEKYVNYYIGNYTNIDLKEFDKRYETKCSAIRNISQNYYHISLWDFMELKTCLEEVGFRNISKMNFGVSNDENLTLDMPERNWETLYVEAQK
jgi:predicted SAM-dependent methyltransferase